MSLNLKSFDVGNVTIAYDWSDSMWYSKGKSGKTREYHFFKMGYLVSESRTVAINVIFGKLLVCICWVKEKKIKIAI